MEARISPPTATDSNGGGVGLVGIRLRRVAPGIATSAVAEGLSSIGRRFGVPFWRES